MVREKEAAMVNTIRHREAGLAVPFDPEGMEPEIPG